MQQKCNVAIVWHNKKVTICLAIVTIAVQMQQPANVLSSASNHCMTHLNCMLCKGVELALRSKAA